MMPGERFDPLRTTGQLVDLLGVPFSDEQLAAITAPMDPSVIVAGAGSGKTTVMAARVVWLVGTGQVAPTEVLGLTFTTKATAELASGVRSRLQLLAAQAGHPGLLERDGEPTVSTYHAYAGSLLREHGLRLGFEPDLRLVSDASRYQLAARAIGSFRGVREHLSISMPTLIGQVIALDNEMSDHLLSIDQVRDFDRDLRLQLEDERQINDIRAVITAAHVRDELLDLVARYRMEKADAGVIEFADQMARGAMLAEQCPQVGQGERDRFAVVLLDEYQDTSVSQRRMLQGLFSRAGADAGQGHPVTAVGDPCQAIYGWRGASVDNIDKFPDHFPRGDGQPARRYALSVNRRCTRSVLQAANDVAGPLYAVHAGAEPLVARSDAAEGRVQVGLHDTVIDEVASVVQTVQRVGAQPGAGGARRLWSEVAVLVRDGNERGALASGLRGAGIPVEVVGLAGLLDQPEVADVLATLRCVASLTANADLLRLLSGPRWRIGPRDLALLGARARELARADHPGESDGLRARLDAAVSGVDDTEVVSLSDALDDPGARDYSAAACRRFAALSAELSTLRRSAGEPLVDVVRRVIDVLGIDVELSVESGPAAEMARDNLALFVDAVADFAGNDQGAGLYGLLAYLDAELEHNKGMGVADPGVADSVKLLTAHAAKGLEWPVVVLPFWSVGVFPSRTGRSRWERTAHAVPVPLRGDAKGLPDQVSWAKPDRDAYAAAHRDHQLLEERRLAYVAVTRAKELVIASGHWWGRSQKNPRGPSPYLTTLRQHASDGDTRWMPGPADGEPNPVVQQQVNTPFPGRLDEPVLARRRLVATDVAAAMSGDGDGDVTPDALSPELSSADANHIDLADLDTEIDTLLAEARSGTGDEILVDLPTQLSASTAMRVAAEPQTLARELARPMPRRPSAAARFGTRFHAWVESHFGQQQLIDPDDLPGRADSGIGDDADFHELVRSFQRGPYAERQPYAVETAFQLVLGGRLIRGRIDAVYARGDGGFDVVDWKTGRHEDADPTQLAIYRLAWAELHDLPLDQVGAAFYYVRTGAVVTPTGLPERTALELQLFGA